MFEILVLFFSFVVNNTRSYPRPISSCNAIFTQVRFLFVCLYHREGLCRAGVFVVFQSWYFKLLIVSRFTCVAKQQLRARLAVSLDHHDWTSCRTCVLPSRPRLPVTVCSPANEDTQPPKASPNLSHSAPLARMRWLW